METDKWDIILNTVDLVVELNCSVGGVRRGKDKETQRNVFVEDKEEWGRKHSVEVRRKQI